MPNIRTGFFLTKREISRLIWLTGTRPHGYMVRTSGFDGCTDLPVSTTRVGNAIVRVLRQAAAQRPDLFPPSQAQAVRLQRQAVRLQR
jgi:hypothetical protein